MTTVYFIRHSVRMKKSLIESYNTNQDNLIKNEKIILSTLGEKRAEILCNSKELDDVDVIYTSNCVRTQQTAKYLIERLNKSFNIDDRFDERRVGLPNDKEVPDWMKRQYLDENYKTIGGESQKEVRQRMYEALTDVIRKNKNKKIAIFSHGYAISFLIAKWGCFYEENDNIVLKYKNKVLLDKPINAPGMIKMEFSDDMNLTNIEVINIKELPYMLGI